MEIVVIIKKNQKCILPLILLVLRFLIFRRSQIIKNSRKKKLIFMNIETSSAPFFRQRIYLKHFNNYFFRTCGEWNRTEEESYFYFFKFPKYLNWIIFKKITLYTDFRQQCSIGITAELLSFKWNPCKMLRIRSYLYHTCLIEGINIQGEFFSAL